MCTGPTCSQAGAEETLQALQRNLMDRGLQKSHVQVTLCRCLGQCGNGPNMVIYPDGVWYAHVSETGAAEIVQTHLIDRKPVVHLLHEPIDPI